MPTGFGYRPPYRASHRDDIAEAETAPGLAGPNKRRPTGTN